MRNSGKAIIRALLFLASLINCFGEFEVGRLFSRRCDLCESDACHGNRASGMMEYWNVGIRFNTSPLCG